MKNSGDGVFVIFLRKKSRVILMIIAFLFFAYLLHWNSFSSPWEGDEGEYAYSAWLLSQDISPYENSFLQKPPLIVYTYYLSHLIFPFSIWAPRLLAFLFTLGVILLLTLIAKKIYGSKIALFVLWISPIFLSAISFDALPANTERFMLLPLTGLLALVVFYRETKKPLIYLAGGVLVTLAFFYKQIALFPLIIISAYWLFSGYFFHKNIRQVLKNLFFLFLGAIITALVSLSYFIFKGTISSLWEQVFLFNLNYADITWEYFPQMLFRYLKVYLYLFWPALILIPFFFWSKAKEAYLWLALLAVSLITIMTTNIPHYYLLLAPFVVLLLAGGLDGLLKLLKIEKRSAEMKKFLILIFTVLIVASYSAKVGEQFFLRPIEIPKWLWTQDNNWGEALLIAEKIKEYTKENEKIFIAGSESQIYYFSERRAATKFNITFPLSLKTKVVGKYQEEVISELENNIPKAIVLPLNNSGLYEEGAPTIFLEYLNKKIEEDYILVGGTISKYQNFSYFGPNWLEPEQIPFDDENVMLLFLLKEEEGL